MDSSWLETRWARPFHLAFVFCLALGLLQAIKLYLRRQRLLRDLRGFPGPSTHWFYGHQKVGRWKGGAKEDIGSPTHRKAASFPSSYPSVLYRPIWPSLWLSASFHYSKLASSQLLEERETPWSD